MGGRRWPPAGLRCGPRARDRCTQGRVRAGPADQERTGQALESKTYAGLARATAGIPAGRAATGPPRQHAAPPAQRVNWKVIAWVLSALIVLPGLGVAFVATYYGSPYTM